MSKKHKKNAAKKRQAKPVYVVRYQLKDLYGLLEIIEGVYEDPEEAEKARDNLNPDIVSSCITVSLLWKKEHKE